MADRTEEARQAIEKVIEEFNDVFVDNDPERMSVPVLGRWFLYTSHDDAVNPELIATFWMTKKHQAKHENIGLLTIALDDVRFSNDG
jgi:hypothetical protein